MDIVDEAHQSDAKQVPVILIIIKAVVVQVGFSSRLMQKVILVV